MARGKRRHIPLWVNPFGVCARTSSRLFDNQGKSSTIEEKEFADQGTFTRFDGKVDATRRGAPQRTPLGQGAESATWLSWLVPLWVRVRDIGRASPSTNPALTGFPRPLAHLGRSQRAVRQWNWAVDTLSSMLEADVKRRQVRKACQSSKRQCLCVWARLEDDMECLETVMLDSGACV
ncbi:hypothetical protein CC1G_10175 [Coprinopsis cinerea okayama7|uniref:Uncharacterized protein n=1 Tax=Coprinopsis cinerea (strain Okayama-7 / 130 / ATCC MYA-4618 / FGSC 9003) TaxID=240176 RepID=A8PGB5_COPC7|nr:hypothetical protein CC1G_10175 [Coprinopsis cinerea okayama7\|eukprot:XP_001841178.2 hypothetical protein CC1G_10175 [Coprinopsis cinerea okayama7\